MTRFPTAQHLASWAGTTPGNNESAGKVKSRRTRPGNPYLQGALGTAAMSISHTHGTYLAAKYRRIATRRGPLKANVAVQRALLVAIWTTAMTNTTYHDPGGDYFTRLNPQRAKQRRPPARGHGATTSPSTRHPDRAAHPANSPHGNLLVRVHRLNASEVQHRRGSTALTPVRCSIVEQHRCVPGGKHETVAIRPDRILGIKPEKVLPQTITTGAIPIRVPGCPELAC